MSVFDSSAGSQAGLEIWRIENLLPVRVDESTFGSFYSGDCYIVLHTFKRSATSSKLDMNLFYWQGSESSQDERGASAYRSVELDEQLGGTPVQHREVQHHESAKFLALFPAGIKYLEGGIESAFRHVDPSAYQPRLFHIKGKLRNVRAQQVELRSSALTEGDCFVLDAPECIYQWNGSSANRSEKFKALEVATKIKDSERGGKVQLRFLESGQTGADVDAFFALLGGTPADVRSAEEGGSDDDVAAARDAQVSLWRLSDASGSLQINEVARGVLDRSMLDSNDVFLLDGASAVFVWIGKGASAEERKKSMTWAAEYLAQHARPAWTPITRLPGGGETPQFKAFFRLWDAELAPANEPEYVARERKLELSGLLEKQRRADSAILHNGVGDMDIWRVEHLKRVPVEREQAGHFYSGDSYIVLFKYRLKNRDAALLYFWQGRDSTTDEKAASALLTVELSAELGDLPHAQVRVVQNKEPSHFLALFQGRMIVHKGSHPSSGAVGAHGGDVQLFHIRGTDSINTRAVEVAPTATSLNSGDCFVLLTSSAALHWAGSGANDDERRFARDIASSVLAAGRPVEEVREGQEPDAFWSALGGKAAYASAAHLATAPAEPRLFALTISRSGDFAAEELFDFSQADLSQEGVFLLDTQAEMFVWIGEHARAADKDAAMRMALEFVQRSPAHGGDTPVVRVAAGAEPPNFTAQFHGWSDERAADFRDPYVVKMQQLQAAAAGAGAAAPSASASVASPQPASPVAVAAVAPAPAPSSSTSAQASSDRKLYSLSDLQSGCPADVKPAEKELHLSDVDFRAALGVERDAFDKLAAWKKADLKKRAGIF